MRREGLDATVIFWACIGGGVMAPPIPQVRAQKVVWDMEKWDRQEIQTVGPELHILSVPGMDPWIVSFDRGLLEEIRRQVLEVCPEWSDESRLWISQMATWARAGGGR